jgi:hypothetical protein
MMTPEERIQMLEDQLKYQQINYSDNRTLLEQRIAELEAFISKIELAATQEDSYSKIRFFCIQTKNTNAGNRIKARKSGLL